MHWYKHNLGDYASDTAGLTMLEHAAYRLLLDAYYSRGAPLPAQKPMLYRICKAHTRAEKRAVTRVLAVYFRNSDGTFKHPRIDQEILKYQARCLANRRRIVHESWSEPEYSNQNTRSTPIASSDPSLSAPVTAYVIPLVSGKEWPIKEAFFKELETAYPEVDLPATLREIRAWCVANPTRRKTERGVMRFINTWCAKEQNRG